MKSLGYFMKLYAFYYMAPLWLKILLAVLTLGISVLMARDAKGRFVSTAAGNGVDRYPQWMKLPVITEAAAGTHIESVGTPTPVAREIGQVMEVLAVQWDLRPCTHVSLAAASGDEEFNSRAQISTRSLGSQGSFSTNGLIDRVDVSTQQVYAEATETGGAGLVVKRTHFHNFACGGKGFLTAALEMFISVQGNAGSTQVAAASARILYRLVKVPLNELVGLVTELST